MSDIVIRRGQLEAWATAIKMALATRHPAVRGVLDDALEQALEDMTDELTDPEEIDIIEDAEMYDPDEPSDGWEGQDKPGFTPTYF